MEERVTLPKPDWTLRDREGPSFFNPGVSGGLDRNAAVSARRSRTMRHQTMFQDPESFALRACDRYHDEGGFTSRINTNGGAGRRFTGRNNSYFDHGEERNSATATNNDTRGEPRSRGFSRGQSGGRGGYRGRGNWQRRGHPESNRGGGRKSRRNMASRNDEVQGPVEAEQGTDKLCCECKTATPKYKCPRCLLKYCSAPCYKSHTGSENCIVQENRDQLIETDVIIASDTPPKEPRRLEYRFPTSDTIKPEALLKLTTEPLKTELKTLLHNPKLRDIIKVLDASPNPRKLLDSYTEIDEFSAFKKLVIENLSGRTFND